MCAGVNSIGHQLASIIPPFAGGSQAHVRIYAQRDPLLFRHAVLESPPFAATGIDFKVKASTIEKSVGLPPWLGASDFQIGRGLGSTPFLVGRGLGFSGKLIGAWHLGGDSPGNSSVAPGIATHEVGCQRIMPDRSKQKNKELSEFQDGAGGCRTKEWWPETLLKSRLNGRKTS